MSPLSSEGDGDIESTTITCTSFLAHPVEEAQEITSLYVTKFKDFQTSTICRPKDVNDDVDDSMLTYNSIPIDGSEMIIPNKIILRQAGGWNTVLNFVRFVTREIMNLFYLDANPISNHNVNPNSNTNAAFMVRLRHEFLMSVFGVMGTSLGVFAVMIASMADLAFFIAGITLSLSIFLSISISTSISCFLSLANSFFFPPLFFSLYFCSTCLC